MKYIITESRFQKIVEKYMDMFLEGKEIEHIPESDDDDDDDVDWRTKRGNANPLIEISQNGDDLMWYEFNTQLLWVNESIFDSVRDMFSLPKVLAEKLIGKWFGSKFGVRVDRVQHSS